MRAPACACLLAVASLSACGGSAPKRSSAVTIRGFAYLPARANVGARVTFENRDSVEHTATADDGAAFDTGSIQAGASKTVSLTRRGSFSYHCDFHPFMRATIVVR